MIHLDEAHRKFVDHLKEKNRSYATVLAYGKDIEQLIDHLKNQGHSHVHHVKKEDLEQFLKNLMTNGEYTAKSVSRKTNSTKTFFRFLQLNEYITDDPAYLISHPHYETKPPRILSKTEYRALRDAAKHDPRMYAIVELLLQSGIRIGELASLKLEDVRLSQGALQGELDIKVNNKVARTIPLNKSAEQALKRYLDIRPEVKERTMFITKTGRPLLVRNIRTSIDKFFKTAGIKDAKVNDLRHTFVAHHLMSGSSILLISKIAGHKRISTTEKYLEFIDAVGDKEEKVKLDEL